MTGIKKNEGEGNKTYCPVETTIGLIGGKYKPLILWKLAGGKLRFSQLQKEIGSATPKMLIQQLRELENAGLVNRKVYPVVPPKVEYSLTDLGESIRPVLEAIYHWGTGYLQSLGHDANCGMIPPVFEHSPGHEEKLPQPCCCCSSSVND